MAIRVSKLLTDYPETSWPSTIKEGRLLILLVALFSSSLISLFISDTAVAVVEIAEFASAEEEARYKSLIAELRCPKCQNQNLLDSDAPIAADLRRKTRSLINQGKSDQEVKTYMLERYGDFVLYKPRFTPATAVLWLGPFLLLAIVVFVLLGRIKRKQEDELLKPARADDEATRIKVRNLMSNTPSLASNTDTKSPSPANGQSSSNSAH